jgi:hypothetical protein
MEPERMAQEITVEQVLEVMIAGDFAALIGKAENERIEFKGALYQLATMREKIELAKDVSALANLGGGIVVMGIGTSIAEDRPYEVAERVRCFPEKDFNVKQYEDVIAQFIYPKVDTQIKWAPSATGKDKGVAYIYVPESQPAPKPFLTTCVLQENDRVLGNVVGFFQRQGPRVVHWSAEEIHHALRDGIRFDQYLSQVHRMLGKMVSGVRMPRHGSVAEKSIKQRAEQALAAARLKDGISYILAAYPTEDTEIQRLFEGRASDVVKLIDHPPGLRYHGFDLATEQPSRIVDGELRRASLDSYKLLEVWRDGTVLFVADGDEGFLCWGNYAKEKFLRINGVALIESVYLFACFVKQLLDLSGNSERQVQMELRVENIPPSKRYGLPKVDPKWILCQLDPERDIAWTSAQSLSVGVTWRPRDTDPANAAYRLVSELYAKFGVEHDRIPYATELGTEKAVDVEQIRELR